MMRLSPRTAAEELLRDQQAAFQASACAAASRTSNMEMTMSMHALQTFNEQLLKRLMRDQRSCPGFVNGTCVCQAVNVHRHNGGEETPVKDCGGQFRTVITVMQPRWAVWERTCFFCSRGMCAPCRGEEGEGRIRWRVRQVRTGVCPSRGSGTYSL